MHEGQCKGKLYLDEYSAGQSRFSSKAQFFHFAKADIHKQSNFPILQISIIKLTLIAKSHYGSTFKRYLSQNYEITAQHCGQIQSILICCSQKSQNSRELSRIPKNPNVECCQGQDIFFEDKELCLTLIGDQEIMVWYDH